MGATLSTLSNGALISFEILNELFIAVGAGVLGIIVLIDDGIKNCHLLRTLLVTAVTVSSLGYVFQSSETAEPSLNKVIFITGCDSGLGFSLAQHACEMGFTVLAGCLKLDSNGARELRTLFGSKVRHIEVDVTRSTSVEVAVDVVKKFIYSNPDYQLWAVINNAGVMVFGEFEWLTERLIQHQIDINLTGTFRLTKALCPLLRQHKSRLINISSHCALATLPGLAVYGATKAALLAWSDGLRIELGKYGVKVISFIPGSFINQSNIMSSQVEHCFEMHNAFSLEQRNFYDEYFKRYNSYLSVLSGSKSVSKIDNPKLYRKYEGALLDLNPKAIYVYESINYSIYHTIFKYSPVCVRDYFVTKFMRMPEYRETNSKLG